MLRESVWRVRAADDELCGEGPQVLDLLHRPEGILVIERPQGGAVQAPIERCHSDRLEVLGLAAGEI